MNDFNEWYQHGIDKGWISPGFCFTHDGDAYMSEEEMKDWDNGGDPCCPVVKVFAVQ